MVGRHLLVRHLRLRITLLAPGVGGQFLRLQDDAGTGRLTRRETDIHQRLDLVPESGRRRCGVDDARETEGEDRPGVDLDAHLCRRRQPDIRRQSGGLPTVDEDVDRAAVMRLAVKGRENALVVRPGLGDQAGRAGCRLVAVAVKPRGVAHGVQQLPALRRHLDLDLVVERFADHVAFFFALLSKKVMPRNWNAEAVAGAATRPMADCGGKAIADQTETHAKRADPIPSKLTVRDLPPRRSVSIDLPCSMKQASDG